MPYRLSYAEKLLERCLPVLSDAGEDQLADEVAHALKPCATCGKRGGPDFWNWHFPCDYDP